MIKYYQNHLNENHDWIGELIESPDLADLVVFTGGADVNPTLYGEKVNYNTHMSKDRDTKDLKSFTLALYTNKPMLGICRGGQFLTAMAGGKLVQHVTGHKATHFISFKPDMFNTNSCFATSDHHQMFFPFHLKKDDYYIIANSTAKLSSTYQNGENNEINFLWQEPEIVYYPKINALAIQGHPEWGHKDSFFTKRCLQLVNMLINNPNKLIDYAI